MQLSSDEIILWQLGAFALNGTIVFTWLIMALLTIVSWLVTRNLTDDVRISRWQNVLEAVVTIIQQQLREVTRHEPAGFLPFLGTLFLFIGVSNVLTVVPGFHAPTGSLSTTAALAVCVFVAVPVFGIQQAGMMNYFSNYLKPSIFMLPFNVMGEFSRTLALAVRLFGNVMSGAMIGAILLIITPFIFPVIMQLFGLLTGLVQAYIFTILAAVYIGAGMEVQKK